MSEAFPPLYNFNGIDFNADFFAIPNSGGGGISIAYANSHYLTNYAGAVSTSLSTSTTFNNDVNVGTITNDATFTTNGNALFKVTTPSAGTATAFQIIRTTAHVKPIFCIDNTTAPRGIGKPLMNIGLSSFTPSSPGDYYGIGYGFIEANGTNFSPAEMGIIITNSAGAEIGDLVFSTRATTTNVVAAERMRITSGGNVGIGKTNPANILQVGEGGRFKIANGTTDYSIIGTIDTETSLNTRIVISGNSRATNTGCIDYLATSAGLHRFYTTNGTSIRMVIASDGNVGIGRTDPVCALEVNGIIASTNNTLVGAPSAGSVGGNGSKIVLFEGSAGVYPYALGINSGELWYSTSANASTKHAFYGANTLWASIDSTGIIFPSGKGIDMTAGGNSAISWALNTAMGVAQASGNFITSASAGDLCIRSGTGKNLLLAGNAGSSTSIFINGANNYVGVNTGGANYPLVVAGTPVNYTITSVYGFVGPTSITANNPASGASPVNVNCTLFVSGNTVCSGNIYITSDERIKKNIQPFEGALSIIDKLNVSTYDYIDYCKFQTKKKQYGLIAQQVMEVIPDVITTHEKEFIPNVYKNADGYDNETKSFILTGSFAIAVGDNLKIMDSKNKEHFKKIVNIQGNVYTIEEPIEDYKEDSLIFIYGKEVNDLHTINYEHLFNINLKAVQELSAIVKAQQEQINKLLSLIK
jgi:hypothetical protein